MRRGAIGSFLLSALLATGCGSAGPSARLFPATVGGMAVISVSQAIAARDRGENGPHAVAGWFSHEGFEHSCPAPLSGPSPLELRCHVGHWGVAERREAVVEVERATPGPGIEISARFGIAQGPWLQPLIEFGEPIFAPETDPARPVPVVLIGHFGDVRAAACSPELRVTCRQRFVATELGWTPGRPP